MKVRHLLALGLLIAIGAQAQPYSVDWFTIDGGGGESAGGVFRVTGTIGQSDAGRMSGGSYVLEGGFWSVFAAIQSPGAPLLRVSLTSSNTVVVAWPVSAAGFNLQQNSSINSTSWSAVPTPPNVVGSEYQVLIAPPAGSWFFRLKSP